LSALAKFPKQIDFKRKGGRRLTGISGREIETRGLAGGFWTDLYHRSMTVSWPTFFATAAAIFVLLNAVYACLYWLGNDAIANVAANGPLGFFYFSVETLATVGYGDMHPQTNYGHLIATVEIFTGMSFLAVMFGLIFSRFSRPRARFIFAKHPVVTVHEGRPTLMIRTPTSATIRFRRRWRGCGSFVWRRPPKALGFAAITSCCSIAMSIRCSCCRGQYSTSSTKRARSMV